MYKNLKSHLNFLSTLGLAISLGNSLAFALTVEKTEEVDGTPDKIWAAIGGWCAIKDWHPAVKTCKEVKKGRELRRILTLQDGGQITERLTGRTDNSYSYVIESSPLPVRNYAATLSVSADDDDDDETRVHWKGTFDPADGSTEEEAIKTIRGIYKDGLNSIENKYDD